MMAYNAKEVFSLIAEDDGMASSTKQAALRLIERLPDDASLEEIMHELYFRQRVDRGLAELDTGQTLPHEEVERSVAQWLQSTGR